MVSDSRVQCADLSPVACRSKCVEALSLNNCQCRPCPKARPHPAWASKFFPAPGCDMGETAVQQGTWDLLLIFMCPAMDLSTIALNNIAGDQSKKNRSKESIISLPWNYGSFIAEPMPKIKSKSHEAILVTGLCP